MSIGALLTVLVFWGGAGLLAFKREPKVTVAILPALIGAIALLVAFPQLLLRDMSVPQMAAVAVLGFGLAFTFATGAVQKLPNVLLFVGVVLAAWGLFRAFPHVDAAFFNFGKNMSGSLDNLWAAMKGAGSAFVQLVKDLASGG